MQTMGSPDQDKRSRIAILLLILTGILLVLSLIGCQIAGIESSRVRPIYYDVQQNAFESSRAIPKPWISQLGLIIFTVSTSMIPTVWIIAVIRGHRFFYRSSTPLISKSGPVCINPYVAEQYCKPVNRTKHRWNPLDKIIFVTCSIVIGLLSAVFMATIFWDLMHHFRQDDNYWPRESSLWWAEELCGATVMLTLTLVPGGPILAALAGFSLCCARRSQFQGVRHPGVARRFVVTGTGLLFLTWLLYFSSTVFLHRHDSWKESQALSVDGANDGIRASILTVLASWFAILGIWSIFSAAIYEFIIVNALGLGQDQNLIKPSIPPPAH